VAMPAVCVRVPSELSYEIARARCRVPVTLSAQQSCMALDLSRQIFARVFLNFSDEPEFCDLMEMEDWANMMSSYSRCGMGMDEIERRERGEPTTSGSAGEAPAAEQGEDQDPALMHNMDIEPGVGPVPRFVFAYSRGTFMGIKIHAFVCTPRLLTKDMDTPGFAADVVCMTRVALGVMIGMKRASQTGGPDWMGRFYPPRGVGHHYMTDLIRALYTGLHSETLLRIYS